jgi:glycosyltransferase involved in cell wall biosynthesis
MPKKKIAIFTGEFFPRLGGIGTFVDNLALAAHGLGHDVTVVAPRYYAAERDNLAVDRPYKVDRIDINAKTRGGFEIGYLTTAWAMVRYLAKNRFDIVHFASDRTFEVGPLVKAFARTPYISTIYGTDIIKLSRSRRGKLLKPFRKGSSDKVFALSEFSRNLLLERYPEVDPKSALVAPPGVDAFWFEPENNADEIRKAAGVGVNDIMIVAVARLDPRKGHDLVIRAICDLPEDLKSRLVFVSVGPPVDADYAEGLDRLATELGVRFVRKGALTKVEVRQHYGAADFVCMPGKSSAMTIEGFGLVFLEAGAQVTPSIASRLGGMSEAVAHEETGLVVDPDNVEALSQAIERLATDQALRDRLAEGAKAFAARYSWTRSAQITYSLD